MKHKKIAVVTGASSGIGMAIAIDLERCGYQVIGVSTTGPHMVVDLATKEKVEILCTRLQSLGKIDVLVNAAGIMPFEESPLVMDVNFWATYWLCTGLRDQMNKNGCIVNIASISGMFAEEEVPIYAASKAAVISLTKSLAKKWAPDVRVNCISPGFYRTNLVPGDTPVELINTIPMGYEESPKNLTFLVRTIIGTAYMTGSNIVVDGGVSL